MSHKRHIVWILTAFAAFWTMASWGPLIAAHAQSQSSPTPTLPTPTLAVPVVVELFTSQSCSSCPPADAVLKNLDQQADVIALGCHVTYWDHLDWKDTLSLPACTARQRAYAAAWGSNRIYTPQMVVNGRTEFVGSNRSKAARAVREAAQDLKPITLTLEGGVLNAHLPRLDPGAAPQTLWLARYTSMHTQAMKSGENRGRTVTYVNPVAALTHLGTWNGQAETRAFALPPDHDSAQNTGGYVLLSQPASAGPIAAAGKLPSN